MSAHGRQPKVLGTGAQHHESDIAPQDEALDEFTDHALQRINATPQQVAQMRANAALPEDSWSDLEDAVYRTQEDVLTLAADLRAAGLYTTTSIYNKDVTWTPIDHQGEASVGMDMEKVDAESSVSYGRAGSPLPIIMDSFSIGFREQPNPASNIEQTPDTLDATVCSRHVNEAIEDLLANGWGPTIQSGGDGYTMYGLTTHPDISTGSLGSWGTDASVIRPDIRAMISAIKDNNFMPGNRGYWLYIGREYEEHLDKVDPQGSGDQTVRDRVENLSDLSRLKVSDWLPGDSALMFRPTEDVVDLAIPQEVGGSASDMTQTVEWESSNGYRTNLQVIGSFTPRVKSTKSAQSGIAYFN